ncbi:hypothetical protein P3X46_015399 [Hevea brasiliensis]|uniref:5-formyltetrahydrofolate cyclo-ligase n=2 Tax=Hevea brasiliensis TaxID=3981 RepID=A0ABQ9LZ35_HEVBR|nr:hypothetical protein P3X46_015399 [Hevea brasiliensis]
MRMLKISIVDDLISNSINILEPALVDSERNHREDVMQAREPVDLVILPGLAFDRSGNRLGCSGGYCDVFLKKCQDLAAEWKWKQPLLVALAYSLHIMEGGAIPVTPNDVPVDALVTPAGFIPIAQLLWKGAINENVSFPLRILKFCFTSLPEAASVYNEASEVIYNPSAFLSYCKQSCSGLKGAYFFAAVTMQIQIVVIT